jgi:lipopolysaccharide export LptBFGC system permease protein LptF
MVVSYLEGILKLANLFLAIIAGIIAISLFKISHERIYLKPWKILIIALVFFAIQEVLGAFRAFNVYSSPFLTHIVPTIIMGLLILTLVLQININSYHKK